MKVAYEYGTGPDGRPRALSIVNVDGSAITTTGDMMGGGFGGSVMAPQSSNGMKIIGDVKNWHEEKGFGFIIPSGGGDDVFARECGHGVAISAAFNMCPCRVSLSNQSAIERD